MVCVRIGANEKTSFVFVDQGVKVNQQTYHRHIFGNKDVPSNRIPSLYTELKALKIGARHIFLTSLVRKNGHRIPQIWTQWIVLFGPSWRQGCMLYLIKICHPYKAMLMQGKRLNINKWAVAHSRKFCDTFKALY